MPYRTKTHKPKSRRDADNRYRTTTRKREEAQRVADQIRSSKYWTETSKRYRHEHPLCEDPFGIHKRENRIEYVAEVHHIKPLITHPELAYDDDNLMGLCTQCHNIIERRGHTNTPKQHVVITGPPGSGKTTKANELQGPLDLIFDLDKLAATLNPTFATFEGRPNPIAYLLLNFRRELITRIENGQLNGFRCILIVSRNRDAEEIAERINAEVINHGEY